MTFLVCPLLVIAAPQDGVKNNVQPPSVQEQLARHGIKSDRQSLIEALRSGDAEVRGLAALMLDGYEFAAIRGDSIPALAEALRTETDPTAASIMARALGGLGDSRGVPALERMCHDSQLGPSVKVQVARFLLDLHSENCLDDVLDLAFNGDDSVTLGVLYLLPQFQRFQHISSKDQDRIVEVIRRGLLASSPHMRLSAAYVRSRMNDGSAATDLQRAIDMELDGTVRDSMRTTLSILQKRTSRGESGQ